MAIDISTDGSEAPLGLVDGPRLLEALFPNPVCRPSLRWLRDQQKRRAVPFIRCGRLIFFDVPQVRRSLMQNCSARGRIS